MVPSLFIGHGSLYLAVQRNEYSNFLNELSKRFEPKAIAIFSAHWGLPISGREPLWGDISEYNEKYLETKIKRSGHIRDKGTCPND